MSSTPRVQSPSPGTIVEMPKSSPKTPSITTPATPNTSNSTISSANSPLTATPAPAPRRYFLEGTKPMRPITGWIGESVKYVRDITGANGTAPELSERLLAGVIRTFMVILIVGTGGLILIPFAFHVIEWRNQAKHNHAFENWVKTNDFATTRLNEVIRDVRFQDAVTAREVVEPLQQELQRLKTGEVGQLISTQLKLEASIGERDGQIQALQGTNNKYSERMGTLIARLNQSVREVNQLTQQLKELQAAKATADQQISQLNATIVAGQDAAKKVPELERQIQDLNKAFNGERQELGQSRQANTGLQKQVVDLEQRIASLKAITAGSDGATQEATKLMGRVQELNNELTKAQAELKVATKDKGDVEFELNNTKAAYGEAVRNLVEARTLINTLNTDYKKIKDESQQLQEKTATEVNAFRDQREALETALRNVTTERDKAKTSLGETLLRLQTAERNAVELGQQMDSLRIQLDDSGSPEDPNETKRPSSDPTTTANHPLILIEEEEPTTSTADTDL